MSSELLQEISTWKLEAKLEDSDRYFYHINELASVENGNYCYVIGRKGTGKTAISEYLNRKKDPKIFSTKLSFKNFPFNDLYNLDNERYRSPNQYITLWKYVIYSATAKLFVQNHNIDSQLRTKLERIYSDDSEQSLSRSISRWTASEFDFKILGSGIKIKRSKTSSDGPSWIEKVEILEDILLKNIDDSRYLIIFDELDEDYKDILKTERHSQYTALLTSLFKAVQDIKSIFQSQNNLLYPVIFLRDDIYSYLNDPDKTKWSDLGLQLDWDPDGIKRLLAFRISRAISFEHPILSFPEASHKIFTDNTLSIKSTDEEIPIFNHMTRHSLLRPRDYIKYIKACAIEANLRDRPKIGGSTVRRVGNTMSNYLRNEWEDEIHGVLPEIKQIFDVISQIRKPIFTVEEFSEAYKLEVEQGAMVERNVEHILRLLFYFSIIGNQARDVTFKIFRYRYKEARLNLSERICVHGGLFRALQIS